MIVLVCLPSIVSIDRRTLESLRISCVDMLRTTHRRIQSLKIVSWRSSSSSCITHDLIGRLMIHYSEPTSIFACYSNIINWLGVSNGKSRSSRFISSEHELRAWTYGIEQWSSVFNVHWWSTSVKQHRTGSLRYSPSESRCTTTTTIHFLRRRIFACSLGRCCEHSTSLSTLVSSLPSG